MFWRYCTSTPIRFESAAQISENVAVADAATMGGALSIPCGGEARAAATKAPKSCAALMSVMGVVGRVGVEIR